MAKNNLMCTVTGIISLWNWDLLSKHTTGYISSIALIAHCFCSVSSSLSIFYHSFLVFFFFFFSVSLYLTPGGLKQAIHAVCVCHNQLQFQQRPAQPRHLSSSTLLSWNPIYFLSPLSPLTHSHSSCMTLADRSYLGSFLPSLQLAYLISLCSSLMPFSKSCCLALFWTVCHALFLVQDPGNWISVMLQTGEQVILWYQDQNTIFVFDVMIQCEAWQIVQFYLQVMSEWPYLWYVLTTSGKLSIFSVMLVLITKYIRLIIFNVWYNFTVPLYKTSHVSGLHPVHS